MLGFLRRKKIKTFLFWFLAIMIVPAFAFMGVQYLNANKKYVATMYGKKIYNSDFLEFKHHYGAYFLLNIGMDPFKNDADEESYSKLWEQYKLTVKAKREKIRATDDELLAFMKTLIMINRNGRFDQVTYESFLKRAKIVPARFEDFLRDLVSAEKYLESEYGKINATDDDILAQYTADTETADIEYVFVSERDTQIYLEQNAPEEELKTLYDKDPQQFKTLPEAKMRYVLVQEVPDEFDIRTINTLEEAAEALKTDIITTEFFTANDEIGSLGRQGFVAQETIDSPIKELNGPFPIDKGKIIFEKIEEKEPYVPAFSNVKERVAKRYAYENAVDKAKERAFAIYEQVRTGRELKDVSDEYQAYYADPEPFKIMDEIDDKLLMYGPFNRMIFDMKENGLIEEPFRFEYGWAIVKRTDRTFINKEKFETEKEKTKSKMLKEAKEWTYKNIQRKIEEESGIKFNRNQ